MGLSVALSNALSGMRSGQNGLDVLSRNVASSGIPGYHRQSLSVIDTLGVNSSYVRNGIVTRAFNESLQQYYTRAMSDSGFTSVRASFVGRPQPVLGKPGTAGSLDTAFADFQTALSAMAVSPTTTRCGRTPSPRRRSSPRRSTTSPTRCRRCAARPRPRSRPASTTSTRCSARSKSSIPAWRMPRSIRPRARRCSTSATG